VELEPFLWAGDRLVGVGRVENCARLLWIRSGSGSITSRQHSETLRPYTLVGIGTEDASIQVRDRVSGYRLEVGLEFLTSSFRGTIIPMLEEFLDLLRHSVLLIHFSQRARCEAEWLLQRMLREDRNSPEFFWASMRLTLGQFLLLCYQRWLWSEEQQESVSPSAESVVNLLRDYVDDHLNEDFGLEQLARRAGYAPSYFSSLFSRVNGQGLTEYISRKRIACAQHLLRSTDLKIVEICYRVGFKDLAHFNRTFKRFVGVTPNQCRQSDDYEPLHASTLPKYACERERPSRGIQAGPISDPMVRAGRGSGRFRAEA
jgi:AraC-like DNA-binding protein